MSTNLLQIFNFSYTYRNKIIYYLLIHISYILFQKMMIGRFYGLLKLIGSANIFNMEYLQ